MPRKNKDDEKKMASQITRQTRGLNGSAGYTDFALSGLNNGAYGTARQGEIASYKRNEARKHDPAYQQQNKVPELKQEQPKQNLKDKGYEGNGAITPIDFGGMDSFYRDLIHADYLNRKKRDGGSFTDAYFFNGNPGPYIEPNDKRKQEYYQKYGMSMDQVLDQYEQYQNDIERAKRENSPFLSGLADFATAPQRALQGFAGGVTQWLLPNSDIANYFNNDANMRDVNEVQQKRDYALDSDKLSEGKKNLLQGYNTTGDILTSLGFFGSGEGIAADPATRTASWFESGIPGLSEKAIFSGVKGAAGYGLGVQKKKHELEKAGVDSQTAYERAQATGAIEGATNAIMSAFSSAASAAKVPLKELLKNAAKSGGKMAAVSATGQSLEELADKLYLDNKGAFDLDVQRLMAQGKSEKDAKVQAGINLVGRVLGAGATGALYGAGSEVVGTGLRNLIGSRNLPANSDDLNEYIVNQDLIGQNDYLGLPDNGTPAIQGQNLPALTELQRPAIRMPGTNGVIPLPNLTPETVSPKTTLPDTNLVPAEPSLLPLQGEELAAAKAQIKNNNATIKALQDEIEIIKNNPKNLYRGNLKKAVQAQIRDKEKQIRQLRADNTAAQRKASGKPAPIREQLSKDDRANLFNYKAGGLDTNVNYTTQYAGNTPEAKALSKEVKNAVRKFVESGDINDYALLMDKATELDNLAKTVNATRSTGNYLKTYSEYYGDSSLVDSIANNEALWHAYALANTNNKVVASSTGIESTPRITEAVGESAPIEVNPENVNNQLPTLVNPESVTDSKRPYSIGVIHGRDGRERYIIQKKEGDYGTRPVNPGVIYETEDEARQALLRAEKSAKKASTVKVEQPSPAPQSVPNVNNNTDAQAYYLRILGDPNFLQEQATAHNLDPNQLVSAANAYLGYSTEVPSFGNPTGTVPPTTPPGDEPPTSGGGPKMKTSETYTNTGKRGGGWTEEEYSEYTDPSQFQYESIDEQESVDRAIQMRQKEGREGFKNRMMDAKEASGAEIDGLMMEWRDLGKEARELEAAGMDASAVRKESIRVFRKIQQLTTNHAQAMQALAKWSRNTPEGMLSRAEHIANGKINKDETDKGKLQKELEKLRKNKKNFQFDDGFVQQFLDEATKIMELDPESREAKLAMANLGKMVNSQIPSTFGEKLITVLMDNMLGNFRTLIARNAGGNVGLNAVEQLMQRPLAAGIDSIVSRKTGVRTQAGLTKEGLQEYLGGFAQGLKEEWDDFKKGLHTARSGENTLENAISSNRHVFNSKVMDKMDALVRHGLSLGDRPFYEGVYNQTLGDYYRLREKGSMGDIIQGLSDDDFKTYAETAARLNALGAVYQKDTALAKALLGIKNSVGEMSRGIFGADILSQFSMPFVKTPANVVDVAVSYSPLGFVRNAAQTYREKKNDSFDQNRFVNDTSRNILGTAGMLGAAGAATAGVLNKGYSEDKDEKKAQKERGEQEYSLNLGNGKQMDIGWIPVLGSNSVAAAAMVDAYEKDKAKGNSNPVGSFAKGLKAGGESLFEQAVFQGMQKLFGGNSYDSDAGIVGNVVETVKSGFGQGIPSLVRQIAQTTDPYQRDLAGSNPNLSFGPLDNYDINSYLNNLPILRELTLAPKVGNNGELIKENQGRNFAAKALENMILPGKVTKVETNSLDEEAARLKEATTSADAFMPRTSRDKVDTDEHTLTNDEWVDYQQRYYGEMTEIGNQIMESDLYQKSNDTVKVKMLKEAYDAIKYGVNSEYNGKSVDGAAKRYVDAGGGEAGIQAAMDYIISGNNEYGLKRDAYNKAVEEGEDLTKYTGYKEALQENGLDDSAERRAEFEKGGASAIQQEASDKKMFKEQFNLDAPSVAPTWQKAKSVFPMLQPNEFDKQFREIAGLLDGDPLAIKQDEITAYINNHAKEYQDANGNWDMDKVRNTWSAYGSDGWAYEPTIKKDGTIGKKKKK